MFRGGPEVEIVPNVFVLVKLVSRSRKFVRLNALKISAWNCKLNLSVNANRRRNEKSHVCAPGPSTVPTPHVPRLVIAEAWNAFLLIQPFGPRSPFGISTSLLTQSARRFPKSESAVAVTVR